MQRIDFYKLERPIQERFVASARGSSPPAPLASHREALPRAVLLWGAIGAVALVALFWLGSVGYGDLESSVALQPSWLLVGYAGLGLLSVFAGIRAAALYLREEAMPFPRAVFLFPSGLIDTRGRELVVRPLSELAKANVGNKRLTVSFNDGFSFKFRLADSARPAELERLLGEYGARFSLNPDAAPVSNREIAAYDPLKDNGFSNPFSPTEAMKPPKLKFQILGPLIALVLGPAIGYAVFSARNSLAEEALYSSARAEKSKAAYEAYVARGGQRPEILEILLPRTELAAIVKNNDLAALESYAATRSKSEIWPEIENALAKALTAELERVKQLGTRAALREFEAKYGKHEMIAPSLERAISDHRARALAKFAEVAKPNPEVLDLFKRLLVYADQHGPKLELKFKRKLADTVMRTENRLRKSMFYGGEASLPAQYFDAKRSEGREATVAKTLLEQFARAFPADTLSLVPSGVLEDASDDLPKVQVPTLLFAHRTEMSGEYLSAEPRAAYTGVGFLCRASLQIPGDDKPYEFKSSTWQAPGLREIRNGASFEAIYTEMADKAFTKLTKRFTHDLLPGLAE
jgi:hypothetical protein